MTGRTHAPGVQVLVVLLGLGAGCKAKGDPPPAVQKDLGDPDAAPSPAFVYEPTLRKVVAPEIPVSLVMEVELPDTGELYVLAAVDRGTPTLELHHFETVDGIVQPDGAEPVQPVRVRASDPPLEELRSLRRRFNAPGGTRRRPIGLAVDEPGDVVSALLEAHAELDAGSHQALATVLRGYSDAIVFEQDAIPEALAAVRELGEFRTEMMGTRRAKLIGESQTIECHRQSGGWVVFAY